MSIYMYRIQQIVITNRNYVLSAQCPIETIGLARIERQLAYGKQYIDRQEETRKRRLGHSVVIVR